MTRVLYILPGLVPPDSNAARDQFTYLSEIAEGEVLLPVWWTSPKNAPAFIGETFPIYRIGNFRYHMFLYYRFPTWLRRAASFFFYIQKGLQLHRKKQIDVIIVYGTNRPGIAGVILKWLTRAKLIGEIPGIPENAFRYDVPNPGISAAIKRFIADQCLLLVGTVADCIKLQYPSQLEQYPSLRKKRVAAFPPFVPVRTISTTHIDERSILLIGYPWHTKGVDVLMRAFKSIADRFPNYKLKLMGYYPDREYLDRLADGCAQIEFLKPASYEIALKTIAACSIYVSASRTEGMPRVVLEAMAARKPIIASAVGGAPYYLVNNHDVLLFQSENVEELVAKLTTLLGDQELRAALAKRAYEKVISEWDERAFVRSFDNMLRAVSGKCET